jgi:hypothetical protein
VTATHPTGACDRRAGAVETGQHGADQLLGLYLNGAAVDHFGGPAVVATSAPAVAVTELGGPV